MNLFPPHLCDFYKTGHPRMYPPGTEYVLVNMTPRSDRLAKMLPDFDHKVTFVGLQGVLKWLLVDLWNENFFKRPLEEVLAKYKRRMDSSLGKDSVPLEHIEHLHRLGYLPLLIKALPEGSRVPMRVPVFTVINTHPSFGWLPGLMETMLSAETWKTITSATIAYEYRRLLDEFAKITGSPAAFVPWQGHDFSLRGMSGLHDGAQTGVGHLASFFGTDTIPALDYVDEHYGCSFGGGSVPATEHSVMCMGGKETEVETFRRLIATYPSGVLSIVSDTWDFWKIVTETAAELKPEILARTPDANGLAKLVFRPDSGDPVLILCGDPDAEPGSPAFKGAVECLWEIFGGTATGAGYKMLDSHVGLIYGDSITLERAQQILLRLARKGFASANVVFGVGSYTYQHVTRDTFGHAIKATWGVVDGVARELSKDPITDSGTKKSAQGLLRVARDEAGEFVLHDRQSHRYVDPFTDVSALPNELRTVFRDGQLYNTESFDVVRERLHGQGFAG